MQKIVILILSLVFCELLIAQDYWMQLDTPDSVIIYKTEISPDGVILLGTNHGIYCSLDEGLSWSKMGVLDAGVTNIEYYSDGEISAGATQLFNSIDQGQSWNLVNPNLMMQTLYCTSDNYLLLGKWGGIWKSVDRGYTWDTVHATGTASTFESFIEVGYACYSGGIDFIGGENSGFHKSENYGNNWELISLQEHGITKLAIDTEGNILAGVSISPNGLNNGLHKSTDNGVSWDIIYNSQQVVQVAVDSLGGYYVGLESGFGGPWGVYYSPDLGVSWQELNSGLDQADVVYDLDINSNYIYCLLLNYKNERTLYRSTNPIVSIPENEQTQGSPIRLFPNPLGQLQNLNIKNESKTEYHLDIINGNGVIIFNKLRIPENSARIMTLNCSNWMPGVYILKFYNESSIVVKKIVKTNN